MRLILAIFLLTGGSFYGLSLHNVKKEKKVFVPHPIFKKGKHKWATQLKPDPNYHFSGARYG